MNRYILFLYILSILILTSFEEIIEDSNILIEEKNEPVKLYKSQAGDLENLSDRLNYTIMEKDYLVSENTDLKSRQDKLENDFSTINQGYTSCKTELNNKVVTMQESKATLDELKGSFNKLNNENTKLSEQNNQINLELAKLALQKDICTTDLLEKTTNLNFDLETLKEQYHSKATELKQLGDKDMKKSLDLADNLNKLKELESKYEKSSIEIVTLKRKINELETLLSTEKQNSKDKASENFKFISELKSNKELITKYQKENEIYKDKLSLNTKIIDEQKLIIVDMRNKFEICGNTIIANEVFINNLNKQLNGNLFIVLINKFYKLNEKIIKMLRFFPILKLLLK